MTCFASRDHLERSSYYLVVRKSIDGFGCRLLSHVPERWNPRARCKMQEAEAVWQSVTRPRTYEVLRKRRTVVDDSLLLWRLRKPTFLASHCSEAAISAEPTKSPGHFNKKRTPYLMEHGRKRPLGLGQAGKLIPSEGPCSSNLR